MLLDYRRLTENQSHGISNLAPENGPRRWASRGLQSIRPICFYTLGGIGVCKSILAIGVKSFQNFLGASSMGVEGESFLDGSAIRVGSLDASLFGVAAPIGDFLGGHANWDR
jgi:hypothetical protein